MKVGGRALLMVGRSLGIKTISASVRSTNPTTHKDDSAGEYLLFVAIYLDLTIRPGWEKTCRAPQSYRENSD